MKDIRARHSGCRPCNRADRINPTQQTNTPNYALLSDPEAVQRRHRSAKEIAADIQAESPKIKEALPSC